MGFTHDEAVDRAVAEIRRFAAVVGGDGVDLAATVPSCPGWDLADLVRHTGEVNRWAATMVGQRTEQRLPREAWDWSTPSDPAGLPTWLAEGADLVEADMRGADPGAPMWAWGWPKDTSFWPRRMVHETGVHRADAELALGRHPAFDDAAAADGIEELLDNLPQAARFAPGVAELKGDGELLRFVSDGGTWLVSLQPDGFSWVADDDDPGADATLATRSTGDLLLTLYRRRAPMPGEVSGRTGLVDHWLAHSSL